MFWAGHRSQDGFKLGGLVSLDLGVSELHGYGDIWSEFLTRASSLFPDAVMGVVEPYDFVGVAQFYGPAKAYSASKLDVDAKG